VILAAVQVVDFAGTGRNVDKISPYQLRISFLFFSLHMP